MGNLIIRISDTHYDLGSPVAKLMQCEKINKENPSGLIITGDISNGLCIKRDLEYLAKNIKCPIYFVKGNHDMWFSSFKNTDDKINELEKTHSNLFCLDNREPIQLSDDDECGLIGTTGWYSGTCGDPNLIKYSLDWVLIKEIRKISGFKVRIEYFNFLAEESAKAAKEKLEEALDQFKTIYLATHFPPFVGCEKSVGSWMAPYFLAYNINEPLGEMLLSVMSKHKKKQLIVLAGHSHEATFIQPAKNIYCIVSEARYSDDLRHEDRIYV
jgi:predicted phosphodiesterase